VNSKRKSSKKQKNSQGGLKLIPPQNIILIPGGADTSVNTPSNGRRSKKTPSGNKDGENSVADAADDKPAPPVDDDDASDDEEDTEIARNYAGRDEDDDDPFGGFGGPGGPPHGLSSTLRALSGMMSGLSARLRDILNNLKQKEDPSMQLIALQELSEILLVSTEDNLSGHFSPDAFVKELVTLMGPSEFGDENEEMMLLACRCLANLMEALPASTANIVYGGAVPILCQKLQEIHFIDLAEQSLSVSYLTY
jgi:E3 ubiquitin-protein ligase TRIP12